LAKLKPELQTPIPTAPAEEPEIIEAEFGDETTALVPVSPGSLAAASPQLAEASALARVFALSGFFPDSTRMAQACVKILAGRDLGLTPFQAMTGLYIVKGKVTLAANTMAALVRRHPRYDYRIVTLNDELCEIDFLMDGKVIGRSSFGMGDARRAVVAGGDNWRKYPRNMLFARAMSNGAKWYCPDIGAAPFYGPEEIGATGTVLAEELVDAAGMIPAE
jgi:hypothetical protein